MEHQCPLSVLVRIARARSKSLLFNGYFSEMRLKHSSFMEAISVWNTSGFEIWRELTLLSENHTSNKGCAFTEGKRVTGS